MNWDSEGFDVRIERVVTYGCFKDVYNQPCACETNGKDESSNATANDGYVEILLDIHDEADSRTVVVRGREEPARP